MTSISREKIPQAVRELCKELRDGGYRAWIVGGCVRDLLLGKAVHDWDIATDATPQEMKKVFPRTVPTGIEHGTMTVLWQESQYEVTTLRGERGYSDGRRPDEVFFVDDIAADLARRDFTINAIALDPEHDQIVDPFKGERDLERKLLRAVGAPKQRFGEDGLRILRGARFVATLEFELESDTEAAFAGALDVYAKVSAERIRDEWLKAMTATKPSRAFDVMRRTGILGVTLPELLEQYGCEQNQWHAYDVWGHTMAVLDASEGDAVEKMAALLHDIGKPRTRAHSDKTKDWTFYHHEKVGADMAERWLRQYRFSNAERSKIVNLVRHHLICYAPEWTDAAVRRFIRRVGEQDLDALLRLGRADALGKGLPVEENLAGLEELRGRIEGCLQEGTALNTNDLEIDGRDVIPLMKHGAGPAIGALLKHLLDRVLDDPALNRRDKLLNLAQQLAEDFESKYPPRT